MAKKVIFEKQVIEGKYQAIEENDKSSKKISMGLLKNGKYKVIWEMEFSDGKMSIVAPFLGIRWPKFSARKTETFIEMPKQLTEAEKLDYPELTRKFLTDAGSNMTRAWLNLGGKRRNIGYFGKVGPGTRYGGRMVHKDFLKILSSELDLKIKSY